jgi:hypothetical protein
MSIAPTEKGEPTMDVREKLEVIAHLGDHITYREDIGICYDSDLAKVIEDAYMELKNGATVQQWISVKDRLPEVVDSYIVVIKEKSSWEKEYTYNVDVATYNPYERAYIDDCWNTYNDWDEGQEYLHITHWMPLPVPPKGE